MLKTWRTDKRTEAIKLTHSLDFFLCLMRNKLSLLSSQIALLFLMLAPACPLWIACLLSAWGNVASGRKGMRLLGLEVPGVEWTLGPREVLIVFMTPGSLSVLLTFSHVPAHGFFGFLSFLEATCCFSMRHGLFLYHGASYLLLPYEASWTFLANPHFSGVLENIKVFLHIQQLDWHALYSELSLVCKKLSREKARYLNALMIWHSKETLLRLNSLTKNPVVVVLYFQTWKKHPDSQWYLFCSTQFN